MGEMVRGTLEGSLLVVVWLALYIYVLGPLVWPVLPGFDEPMHLATGCVSGCATFPATQRGWLALASTTLVVVGYVVGMLWLTWDSRWPIPDERRS